MHSLPRLFALLFVAAALAVAGCSKADKKEDAQSQLAYIPADTPYAFVSLEPMPKGLIERLKKPQLEMISAYVDIAKKSYNDYSQRAKDEGHEPDEITDNKWVAALAEEFKDGVSEDTFTNLGFDQWHTPAALYGHGVLPVLRLELAQPEKFRDFIARVEKRADDKIPTKDVGGQTVWIPGDKEARMVIAVVDGSLIVTGMPGDASDEMLAQLVGVKKPDRSLADTSTISDLMKAKGYKAQGVGFVDSRQILKRIVDTPTGVDQELFSLLGADSSFRDELTPVCKAELLSMADVVPRMLFGITDSSDSGMDFEYVAEVKKEYASQMTGFSSPVPGLGQPADFLSFGFSFDLAAIQQFVSGRLQYLKNNPYECEFLAIDPQELDKAYMGINNPAAGMFQGIHGFNFMVDYLDVDRVIEMISKADPAQPDIPGFFDLANTALSAKIFIAADNAPGLFGMAQMMAPPLAGLSISLDGDPVRINDALPAPVPIDVYATMSEKVFAISTGKDADAIPKSLLTLDTQDNPPMLSYSLNGEKYMKILAAVFENPQVTAQMTKEDPDADIETMRKMFKSLHGVFGQMTVDMRFRDDGMVFEQSMHFAD